MPAFQAINLEPEENLDEPIDTTKEIHVDEALKRFQTALKLHAQGPRAREAAEEAYEELFRSEIFTYREAKTDYERAEQQADDPPEQFALESLAAGLDIEAAGADGVSASLCQALYLAHKNYGQFHLDKIKDRSRLDPEWKGRRMRYQDDGTKMIVVHWTAALDQDPSDPELWRRLARLAGSLNSGRIKRYCLEAAVELDDDPTVMEIEPPSLAEGLAGEQLKDYLRQLEDYMALSHPIMSPWLTKEMPDVARRLLDPIPFLPDSSAKDKAPSEAAYDNAIISCDSPENIESFESGSESSVEAITTWPDFGLELIKCHQNTRGALRACQLILETIRKAAPDLKQGEQGETLQEPDENANVQTDIQNSRLRSSGMTPKQQQASYGAEIVAKASDQAQKEREYYISTRKRLQSVAGLPDGAEEDNGIEKRSKRMRRRTDVRDAEEATDPSTLIANQIQLYQDADSNLFRLTKNILENVGVEDQDTLSFLQEMLDSCTTEDRASKMTKQGAKDLRAALTDFNEEMAMVFLNKKEQATLGLSSFLEHAKSGSQDKPRLPAFDERQGLAEFAERVSKRSAWMTSEDICFEWIRVVSESYTELTWSDTMKMIVVQMLNRVDILLYKRITRTLERCVDSVAELQHLETMIPMLLELHVEIFESITNPSSAVDYATREETKYRLNRWLDVALSYANLLNRPHGDALCVRILWAAVMTSSLLDNPMREHILLLWTCMRDFLLAEGVDQISLPNNVVMPSISAVAADREISKLTTMDFFLGLFQGEMEDAVQVIETLEPVLNPCSVYASADSTGPPDAVTFAGVTKDSDRLSVSKCATQEMCDLWKFLASSSTELRLFLWSRLGDAYAAIQYHTKRLSCILRSIEMIVADIKSERYAKTSDDSRRLLFMRMMKSLDELLIQALSMVLNDSTAFEIIDDDHIKSSASALAKLSCVLHVAALCEDEARVGITNGPSNSSTFASLIVKLHDMQVRNWSLQYILFKAGLPQQEGAVSVENDLAGFLASVHRVIGLRRFCKSSNKVFLKMMRMELLQLQNVDNWEDDLGQVLYDLHGLKLGVCMWEVQDHGCPHEKLEKQIAMQLVEKIMVLARRMPMKDLLKSDLKTTIEYLQQATGQTKSTPQMIHNLRNFTEVLRRPIHPLRLYQAFCGGVSVDAVGISIPEASLARHGWFFLLGMMALTKFKGVDLNRRQTPGATDDLRIGATFLRLQLQFTADNWEAWFRLAECFDYELDESVLWTADKMNKDRAELVKFQRHAIHCYTLAVSHSRFVEVDVSDGDALHDLYHKFAMRLYSSSREPFAMEPFDHSDQQRFFIENVGAGTFKRIVHDQMSKYKIWKLAAKLFRMAMERKPENWMNSYMLAKCYWKMQQTSAAHLDVQDQKAAVSVGLVLKTLRKAIAVATNARKSRNSDPILEPHYKIVSVLHKMVLRRELRAAEAATILSAQPFGAPVSQDDHYASFSEPEDWEEYIIQNLNLLRDRDKSNWHHRIVMRHARILFEDGKTTCNGDTILAAQAAFAVLKENMFTKTMVMNVWKCDAERPGRHHVFTEQYVRFMTRLLFILEDRANLELLLRRLRKKGADFYHFADLWQLCCSTYLSLLRAAYQVRTASEDALKSLSNEDFEVTSQSISEWAAGEDTTATDPRLACMREAVELKKLNANLMKATPIDDLISDCYIKIYLDIASIPPAGAESKKAATERKQAKDGAFEPEAAVQAELKAPSSLNSILNPVNGRNGQAGAETPNYEADKTETAPRSRRAIRRSEVLRKAEQAVVRWLEAPAKLVKAKSRVGSVSRKHGNQTPAAVTSDAGSSDEVDEEELASQAKIQAREEDLDEEMKDADATEEVGDEEAHGGVQDEGKDDTDVGSIHDSADDESDLSDVPEGYDEEVPPGLLFPNLGRIKKSTELSGEEADSESAGNDDDETEEEDDGQRDETTDEEDQNHGKGDGDSDGDPNIETLEEHDTADSPEGQEEDGDRDVVADKADAEVGKGDETDEEDVEMAEADVPENDGNSDEKAVA